MHKTKECEGCPLIDSPGPVPSELNDEAGWDLKGDTDVMFASEAPGRWEIEKNRPFSNPRGAGGVLRSSLEQMGIDKFGIVNVWRCKPPGNKLPDTGEPGKFCKDLFVSDLLAHNQKVTVPLGGVGLNALTEHSMSITSVQGRVFNVNFDNTKLLLLPMLHPAFLVRQRMWWRDWELGMEKLKRYLDSGELNYIPLSGRKVHQAKSRGETLAFIRRLRDFEVLSCDIETASFNMPWEDGEIISIAFAWNPTEACAFPWRYVTGEVFDELKLLLEDGNKKFLWYNGTFDIQFLWTEGIDTRIGRDAMLEAHLVDERLNAHSLKKDSGVWLNQINWEEGIKKYEIPKDRSETAQNKWRTIPEEELLEYNGQDTTHTLHLSNVLRDNMGSELRHYADALLVPAFNMLSRARYVGIRVDMYRIKELRDTFVPILDDLEHVLIEISGDSLFNPRSSPQKLALLKKRGLNVNNVQKETLQMYEGDEAADAMVAYSEAHKMYSTYIMGIVDDVSDDLRVHPDWETPVETGRLRCTNPNMLGIPRKAEEWEHKWKRRIKEIFIADKDTLLMHVDQKQSEVRVACFLAQDEVLAEVIRSGRDIHGEMAHLMYGDVWTYEQRVLAKMVTFGLIYNREAPSLARQLTAIARAEARARGEDTWRVWTVREAQAVIDLFFRQMPRLLGWKKETMKLALSEGELTSLLGRKRRFGLITYENKKEVENEAVNFPISSVSSDINLMNCIETMKRFGKYGVEVLAPIHDAGLLRIPKDSNGLVADITGLWEELPPYILQTDLPFKVDVTVGERWSDL